MAAHEPTTGTCTSTSKRVADASSVRIVLRTADMRERLCAFLHGEGAHTLLHDREQTPPRSLADHLLGTFDLLREAGCSRELQAAGALHSIYGTKAFAHITVVATAERRAEVAAAFGERAELLAYLFHATARPRCLDAGELVSRLPELALPAWAARDVHQLRLLEAANLLEQGLPLDKWPNVRAAWEAQRVHSRARRACAPRARSGGGGGGGGGGRRNGGGARPPTWRRALLPRLAPSLCLRLRVVPPDAPGDAPGANGCVPRRRRGPPGCVRLRYTVRNDAVLLASSDVAKLQRLLLAAAAAGAQTEPSRACFRVRGEGSYGMPPAPVPLLAGFAGCRCAGRWRDNLPPLEIEPAILAVDSPSPRAACGRASHAWEPVTLDGGGEAGAALAAQLAARGYAVVRVDAAAAGAVSRAYAATAAVLGALSREQKKLWRQSFDAERYVGCARDGGREWVQVRAGATDPSRFAWPKGAAAHREAFAAAFDACDALGRAALRSLLAHYGSTATAESILDPPRSRGGGGSEDEPRLDEDAFGGSVQRFFQYPTYGDDARPVPPGHASRAHADFGLLTVAPAGSVAALELSDPASGAWSAPEAALAPCEWLLFSGQALSYLTAGALPSPIHRVPRVRRAAAPSGVRCSAPHFVRPAPSAELCPLRGDAPPLTFRELVTEHTMALRPWGHKRAAEVADGDASSGDW